jgi:hypothetical protein
MEYIGAQALAPIQLPDSTFCDEDTPLGRQSISIVVGSKNHCACIFSDALALIIILSIGSANNASTFPKPLVRLAGAGAP